MKLEPLTRRALDARHEELYGSAFNPRPKSVKVLEQILFSVSFERADALKRSAKHSMYRERLVEAILQAEFGSSIVEAWHCEIGD